MISVLTLNLRFGLADDGPNSWQYRKKVFPFLFEKYRTDFIGFQEANDFQTDFLNGMLTEYDFIGKCSPSLSFWQDSIIFIKNLDLRLSRTFLFESNTHHTEPFSGKPLAETMYHGYVQKRQQHDHMC